MDKLEIYTDQYYKQIMREERKIKKKIFNSEKVECTHCGKSFKRLYMKKHKRSKKCINYKKYFSLRNRIIDHKLNQINDDFNFMINF